MNIDNVLNSIAEWATTTGVRILIAIFTVVISFKVIRILTRKLERRLMNGKHKPDKTLVTTLVYSLRILLQIVIITCMIGYLGVDTSGIAALIASLGVGFGLAINGAVSNLAGGILIILTRPFKIDDFIEAQGYSGTVEEIHVINTRIRTPDNKVVYIPNGSLSSDTIVNFSEKETRRVDFTFHVSYTDSFETAKEIILGAMRESGILLCDPEPMVRVSAYGEHGVEITARGWVKREDYWSFKFGTLERVKREFDRAKIAIPYNQLDVHLKKEE